MSTPTATRRPQPAMGGGRQDGERYGEMGQASGRMPYFVNILTQEQIEAIVDYERSL